MKSGKTGHEQHKSDCTPGDRLANKVTNVLGSWKFIVIQTAAVEAKEEVEEL